MFQVEMCCLSNANGIKRKVRRRRRGKGKGDSEGFFRRPRLKFKSPQNSQITAENTCKTSIPYQVASNQ